MTQRAHDLTELTRAAKTIREAADAAAGDNDHDRVCCWGTQRRAHQESVTETRIDEAGHDETDVLAVTVDARVAAHIGLWGPNAGRAVADWLDSVVERHIPTAPVYSRRGENPRVCLRCIEPFPCADARRAFDVADEILGTKHDDLHACTGERAAQAANLALVR